MCRSLSLTATTQRSQNINQASRRNSNNEIGHHNPKAGVSTDGDAVFTFPSPLAILATAAAFAAAKRRVVTTGLIGGVLELGPVAVKLLLLGLEVLEVPEPQNEKRRSTCGCCLAIMARR
ncbi:hypothetical protein GQX74_002870 [Glossina fuscipes]|nr:hypothetical protein GQX74_002870 [Glossina fuscipes]